MRALITFVLIVISINLFSQNTDTVSYYVDQNLKPVAKGEAKIIFKTYQINPNSWVFATYSAQNILQQKETYSDSLLVTKQGQYVEYILGKTSLKGNYNNGLKHGNFVNYDTAGIVQEITLYRLDSLKSKTSYWPNGGMKEEMIYGNDNRLAKKSIFYEEGKLALKEVYGIKNSLIEQIYLDIDGKQAKAIDIMSPPTFPGGVERFYRFLATNIKYPIDALQAGISGQINASFTITETGEVTNIKIERKLFPSLDREAERVLKNSPKWIPGKLFGKTVSVRYNIPIKFNTSNLR